MIAFTPSGNLASFTSASSAPTSVQSITPGNVGTQQYKLSNTDTTNDAVIGWGATDAIAKANAAAPATGQGAQNCTYLMHGTVEVITAPVAAYFSGIAVASTAVIKVQAGYGS